MKRILYILFIFLVIACTKEELVAPKNTSKGKQYNNSSYLRTTGGHPTGVNPGSVVGGDEKGDDDDNDSAGESDGGKIIHGGDQSGTVIGGDEKGDDDDNDSKTKK